MRNINIDREIAAIARRQHGVFTTPQARAVGATAPILRNRLANGVIVQLAPKVWATAANPPTWQRQYKAAELSVSGAALCDGAAAWVHGLPGARVGRPAVAVSREVNRRQALATVHRRREVPVVTVDGFQATSVSQTLFDLLARWNLVTVERALDDALLRGVLSIDDLMDVEESMERLRRPTVPTWRALVEERHDLSWHLAESELEVALQRVLRRLPLDVDVRLQATPPWWQGGRQRVDAYLPGWQLIVEADGRRWHARAADFERDRWRDNSAVAHGHRVLRFTHTVLTTRPDEAFDLLLAAGAAATTSRAA